MLLIIYDSKWHFIVNEGSIPNLASPTTRVDLRSLSESSSLRNVLRDLDILPSTKAVTADRASVVFSNLPKALSLMLSFVIMCEI